MVQEPPPGHSFRLQLLSGGKASPIVGGKRARRDSSSKGLKAVTVPRSEGRRTNQRGSDRKMLGEHEAILRKGRTKRTVRLINMSGGGAMIEGEVKARLWDKVTLVLGEHGEIEAAVRWIRDNRLGLEFAHETRIDCDAATLDKLLESAIRNSFSEAAPGSAEAEAAIEQAPAPDARRESERHPLIWMGKLHCSSDSYSARLRNISSGGALIETAAKLEPDEDVTLDLGDGGSIRAKVGWSRGEQCGLRFKAPFDIVRLAQCRPEIAPTSWAKPDYLRDESTESSPWASEWGRLTLTELGAQLKVASRG